MPVKFVRAWHHRMVTSGHFHWYVVATVCVGAFIAALNVSISNIAMPYLAKSFGVSMSAVAWVSLSYLLTSVALLVPFGRLADMIGRKWMYTGGFVVFVLSALLSGMTRQFDELVLYRALQGVGGALLQANSFAIITAATPTHARGRAIGFQASAQGLGLSLGTAIGGAILTYLAWPWIFLISVPISLFGIVLGVFILPRDAVVRTKERFDFVGALSLAIAIVSLVYCLNMGVQLGWMSRPILWSATVCMVALVLFVVTERRVHAPLVDLSMFLVRAFTLGSVTATSSYAVLYAVLFLVPFYLYHVAHASPFSAGLYLLIVPLCMAIFTPISGSLADRHGPRIPLTFGMLSCVLGLLLLVGVAAPQWQFFLVIGLACVGAGIGIFTSPNNSTVMGSARKERLGIAGGMLNMFRTLGTGLGIAIAGLSYQVFFSLTQHIGTPLVSRAAAFQATFLLIGVIALLTLIGARFAAPSITRY